MVGEVRLTLGLKLLRSDRSGQVLIVAALAIAVLISSTTIYVYEQDRNVDIEGTRSIDSVVFSLEQGARNALISSLVNVSRDGPTTVLASNLETLSTIARDSYGYALCNLGYSLLENSDYQSGFWLSWNTSTNAVSSVFARFNLTVQSGTASVTRIFEVNATTGLAMNGSYAVVGSEKQVNLSVAVYDEEGPASAGSFAVFCESNGNWTQVDALSLIVADNGDGTYSLSFSAPSDATNVCLHMFDSRGIRVESLYDIT